MQVDATQKTKPKPSKEVIDNRREKKLCFECGLPGHQAAMHRRNKGPWKGKRKQANVMEHGPRQQICATGLSRDDKEFVKTIMDAARLDEELTDSDADDYYIGKVETDPTMCAASAVLKQDLPPIRVHVAGRVVHPGSKDVQQESESDTPTESQVKSRATVSGH